jgi:hypothetical protein
MRVRFLVVVLAVLSALALPAAAQEPVAEFQAFLSERGCDLGAADGSWGPRTTAAAQAFSAQSGIVIDRPVTEALLTELRAGDVQCPKSAVYELATRQEVDFGYRIDFPYVLDAFDVNGDGTDDFAISGKTHVTGQENERNERLIRSFLVITPPEGEFNVIDLGEGGLTRRTWDAKFLKGSRGETLLALGRDGELGLPHTHEGEVTSIFEIAGTDPVSVTKVYEVKDPGTTSSVESCDIDGDGFPEIYVNNNGGKESQTFLAPHFITVGQDGFEETSAAYWLRGTDKDGSYNEIALADVNGDGACDFLAAIEAEKAGSGTEEYTTVTTNDRIASYVVFNRKGTFAGESLDLPNPVFGENNAAFSIATVPFNGETLIALTTAEFRGHHLPFRGFVFQLFAYRGGEFVEVTEDLVSGTIDNDEANQSQIRVLDLDADGDEDIYFARYSGAIQVYINNGGQFVRKRISVDVPGGQKAVAFVRSPASECPDLAVLHVSARLYRFGCSLAYDPSAAAVAPAVAVVSANHTPTETDGGAEVEAETFSLDGAAVSFRRGQDSTHFLVSLSGTRIGGTAVSFRPFDVIAEYAGSEDRLMTLRIGFVADTLDEVQSRDADYSECHPMSRYERSDGRLDLLLHLGFDEELNECILSRLGPEDRRKWSAVVNGFDAVVAALPTTSNGDHLRQFYAQLP